MKAQTPSVVWKLSADVGQAVETGDELAILESMKIEVPVAAPESGTVVAVHVAESDSVAKGDVLFVIDVQ